MSTVEICQAKFTAGHGNTIVIDPDIRGPVVSREGSPERGGANLDMEAEQRIKS